MELVLRKFTFRTVCIHIVVLKVYVCIHLSDRADAQGILTLRSLLQDGRVSLPDGETVCIIYCGTRRDSYLYIVLPRLAIRRFWLIKVSESSQ